MRPVAAVRTSVGSLTVAGSVSVRQTAALSATVLASRFSAVMFKFLVLMTTVTLVLDEAEDAPASTVSPIAVIDDWTCELLSVVSTAVGWSRTKLRTTVASFAVVVVICVEVERTLVVRSRAAAATAAFASAVACESSLSSDDGDDEGDGAGVLGGSTETTETVEEKMSETVAGGRVESAEVVVDVACGSRWWHSMVASLVGRRQRRAAVSCSDYLTPK